MSQIVALTLLCEQRDTAWAEKTEYQLPGYEGHEYSCPASENSGDKLSQADLRENCLLDHQFAFVLIQAMIRKSANNLPPWQLMSVYIRPI